MKCSDIPEMPVLEFLYDVPWDTSNKASWGMTFAGFDNYMGLAMPEGIAHKLVMAKLRSMVNKGLIDGCLCGCRGDFELTEKGDQMVREYRASDSYYGVQRYRRFEEKINNAD